jgi:hypothetical protein
MKNLIVANYRKDGKCSLDELKKLIQAQIDNSLDLGWDRKDLIILANFEMEHNNVTTQTANLNDSCFTGSKIFATQVVLKDVDVVWSHDLDAWQNVWFDCPEFKDVGISCYSRPKLNGGSIFWRKSAQDMVDEIANHIKLNNESKEEPTINKILSQPQYKDRVTILDHTFNVGCSGYIPRYQRAIKPIRVCHFHPTNSIAWETHALDRSGAGISITPRLEKLIRSYWPSLAKELSKRGKKRRQERIDGRLHKSSKRSRV